RWKVDQLDTDSQLAIARFREERMKEPLENYLQAFDQVRDAVENLLEMTVDLSKITDSAVRVLTDPAMLEAIRYLAGPPISEDDLKIVADAVLSPKALLQDPAMAKRVVDTVLLGLD